MLLFFFLCRGLPHHLIELSLLGLSCSSTIFNITNYQLSCVLERHAKFAISEGGTAGRNIQFNFVCYFNVMAFLFLASSSSLLIYSFHHPFFNLVTIFASHCSWFQLIGTFLYGLTRFLISLAC